MTDILLKGKIEKVDASLGLAFGYAIVCEEDGQPYFDKDSSGESHHIPPSTMMAAAKEFAKSARSAKEMHTGDDIGFTPFLFPMTSEVAQALGMTVQKTGLLIGMAPDDKEVLAKFADGTYTGFSIGGRVIESTLLETD